VGPAVPPAETPRRRPVRPHHGPAAGRSPPSGENVLDDYSRNARGRLFRSMIVKLRDALITILIAGHGHDRPRTGMGAGRYRAAPGGRRSSGRRLRRVTGGGPPEAEQLPSAGVPRRGDPREPCGETRSRLSSCERRYSRSRAGAWEFPAGVVLCPALPVHGREELTRSHLSSRAVPWSGSSPRTEWFPFGRWQPGLLRVCPSR